ncbi:MAG: NYN domain-containing protein [bacterium]|nr:NYN domain-containing protein [bacterium]
MIWIDGHNVLRTVPELFELYRKNHVTAMQRLLGRANRERAAVVVFDGKPVQELVPGQVKVVFVDDPSNKYERADRYILLASKNDPDVTVVTFDLELLRIIRERRGKTISPIKWFHAPEKKLSKSLTKRTQSSPANDKTNPPISASEYLQLLRNRTAEEE